MNWFRGVWLLIAMLAGQAQAADLAPEFWDRPRSAQTVLAQPAIRQAVAALQYRSDARMLIVHGTRQESQAQAEELRAWLVALAVESARVQLRADLAAATIRLEIVD
jgi:hypothetical protein